MPMSRGSDPHRAEFLALIERAVRIGALLPDSDQVDVEDPVALAGLKVVMAEFNSAASAVKTFRPKG